MGCFDIFCFICGNPCHSIYDIEYIQENINKNLSQFGKNTLWMNNCSMLLFNNTIMHNLKDIYDIEFLTTETYKETLHKNYK